MQPAISIENLGKRYIVDRESRASGGYSTLRESLSVLAAAPLRRLSGGRRTRRAEFWALQDVSFEVRPGEVVGIIGRNGAGKSTLLKILSQITKPTKGAAVLHGRVGSLLEVGTGFHPELTGRENIFLNGSILGMRRTEIQRKFNEIVEFAEIEPFLDTPVKRYSSGMYVRLAFAVAAHLEPEILIIDEVLAVGDAGFQHKCIEKIRQVAREGRTILFVSHNFATVQQLCHRGIVLQGGKVQFDGPSSAAVQHLVTVGQQLANTTISTRTDRRGAGLVRFDSVRAIDRQRTETSVATGEPACFEVALRQQAEELPAARADVAIVFRDLHGNCLTTLSTHFIGQSQTLTSKQTTVQFLVERFPLHAGRYRLDLWCATGAVEQDYIQDAAFVEVRSGSYYGEVRDLRLPQSQLHGAIAIPFSCETL